ncbi:DMT family transporter [Candidatus Microgenomates bacterium]|nr:DMT family transporter [Candidatus Microgenomates bacterium]
MTNSRLLAYGMLLITAAIWGIATPIIKFTLNDFPFIIFLTYRFFLTSLVLLPIYVFTHKGKNFLAALSRREVMTIIAVGLLGSSINLGLLFWGLEHTTAIFASLLSDISPIFVALASIVFLKERISSLEKVGLGIAFLGASILTFSPSFADGTSSVFGNLLILLANFAWVGYVILAKAELRERTSPLFLITTSFILGFITMLPLALWQTGSIAGLTNFIAQQPLASHMGVWYMALISGALAYWLFQEGQRRIEASQASIFIYLSPIFAIPLSVVWLGEKITLPIVIGATVTIIGVVIAEYKKRKKVKS